MDAKVRVLPVRHKKANVDSVAVWCSDQWGGAPVTWLNRAGITTEHSAYMQVAKLNRGFLRFGMTEHIGERMAVVEGSLIGETVPALADILLAAAVADATEDVSEAEFRNNPCKETAAAWKRKLAHDWFQAGRMLARLEEDWGV